MGRRTVNGAIRTVPRRNWKSKANTMSAGRVSVSLLCLAVFMLSSIDGIFAVEKPHSRLDRINVDDVLRNERLVKRFYDCLIQDNDRRCTVEAKELKDNLADAFATRCGGCTEKQKNDADKVLRYLIENKADMFKNLSAKYNPDGSYYAEYKEKLEKEKKEQAEKQKLANTTEKTEDSKQNL